MTTCEYCNKSITECLKWFEVSFYNDNRSIMDFHCKNINEAIELAYKHNTEQRKRVIYFDHDLINFVKVYQGCDRNNELYQQYIN